VQLLLGFLLSSVVIGLFTERLDRRVVAMIAGGSLITTVLFYSMGRWWV